VQSLITLNKILFYKERQNVTSRLNVRTSTSERLSQEPGKVRVSVGKMCASYKAVSYRYKSNSFIIVCDWLLGVAVTHFAVMVLIVTFLGNSKRVLKHNSNRGRANNTALHRTSKAGAFFTSM
jgi:hypothetical protein